jgi:ubiquinone biosynthesis protein UbiJ
MLDRNLAAAANHLLGSAEWAAARLRAHAGKQACLHIGSWTLHLRVGANGLLEPGDRNATSEVTLEIPPHLLGRWLLERDAAARSVRVTGDATFAEALSFVAANLRWDFEEDLSRLTGEIVAYRIGEGVRALQRWRGRAGASIAANITEYLTEERGVLPTRLQAEGFLQAVDEVRDAVERLEKRLALLEQRRAS